MSDTSATFGRYLLGPRLAVGGMGEVYVATQLGMGAYAKPLVLKLLLPHLSENPRAVEMFLTEARLASRMNHPNVVHIFDVGVAEGRHFIALELVNGVSLSVLLGALKEANERLTFEQLLFVARSICDGLHHAHEQRGPDGAPLALVHRDVTPENVLVSVEGQVKLTDFGVARASDQGADGSVVGKMGYIAPEVLLGERVDRRADVFSAGVTLFVAATLQHPFKRESKRATLEAVLREPLPDLSALRPELPAAFVQAVGRACAKDPSARFASVRAMRDALPLPAQADAGEALGALLLQRCREKIGRLNAEVEKTQQLRARTEAVSSTGALEAPKPRPRRWPFVVVPLALGLGSLAAISWTGREAPLAPVVDAGVALAPVAAPEVLPELVDAGPAVVEAEPPKPEAPRPTRHVARPPPIETAPGFLVVDANPWARVTVNGNDVGETPIASFPVPSGYATVVFTNSETGRSATRRVKVVSGQKAFVRADLR